MRPLLLLLLFFRLLSAEAASAIAYSAEAASAIACSAEAEGSSEQEMRGYAPRSSSASAVTPELAVPDSIWKKLDAKLERYQAVTDTKIEELTREVRKHNGFAERIPLIEAENTRQNERIKALENRSA